MKAWKLLLVAMVVVTTVAVLAGCSAAPAATTNANTVDTVSRGNVSVDITAAGNLALSHTEDLPVDLFYPTGTKGTIGEVNVEAGDSVKASDVLVTVDKSEWNEQLTALEDQVTTQQRNLLQAQINVATAQQNLKTAQDAITSQQTTILNVQLTLKQAQDTLNGALAASDDQAIIAAYQKAQTWYDYTMNTLPHSDLSADDVLLAQERAQDQLTVAKTAYDNLLAGVNGKELELKQQVDIAQRNLDAANTNLQNNQNAVLLDQDNLTLSQGKLEDAQKALSDAKTKLANAQTLSPEIKAPFDGFVTAVNVKGGDEVLNGTIAVTVADPNKFEADILVSEIDIMQVHVGGQATIQADALPGVVFPATVTHVSPTATIQSGVVNYNVKVELDNTANTTLPSAPATPPASANTTTSSGLPAPLQQAVDSGRMTQQQAEAIAQQMQSGGGTLTFRGSGQGASQLPSGMATQAQNAQLRDGLTVTVTIMVARATDVLVVPNGAVTTQGGKSYVTVVNANGTTEQREVQTGLSDWQNIEITGGLTEGEKVSVPLSAAPSSSGQNRGPVFFGGPRG
jgi:multidrug efflux pump subunit AcrA (membrane-fusion protein)